MTNADPFGDFGACVSWPDGLENRLDTYRQGHVIDDVPPFFLEAENVRLWRPARQRLSSRTPAIVGEDGCAPRSAMLLTQACDLMKRGNAWITVAPVYDAAERLQTAQHAQARTGQLGHLVHITADWAVSGLWVADLRLEMPLEKTALMERLPREAFADEVGYADLAVTLGARRQRPAAPQTCIDLVSEPLYEALRAMPDGGAEMSAGVREIRFQWNDPTYPTVVSVFVVAVNETSRTSINYEGWTKLLSGLYQRASAHGLTIVGPEITSLDDMSATDYLTSALIEDVQSS